MVPLQGMGRRLQLLVQGWFPTSCKDCCWENYRPRSHGPKARDTKPKVNPDLIAVSISPRHISLINQSGSFWLSTSKATCHVGLLYPSKRKKRQSSRLPSLKLKRSPGLKIILSFLLLITPSPHPSSYKKLCVLYNCSKLTSSCYMGCCLIHESLNKAN